MSFSWEFDCWLHMECLNKRLDTHPDDEEALIIKAELQHGGGEHIHDTVSSPQNIPHND